MKLFKKLTNLTYTPTTTSGGVGYEDLTKSFTHERTDPTTRPPKGRGTNVPVVLPTLYDMAMQDYIDDMKEQAKQKAYSMADAKYAVLLGNFIGFLEVALYYDIPEQLVEIIEKQLKELRK